MEEEHGQNADDDQSAESIACIVGKTEHMNDDDQIHADEHQASAETDCLANRGKNEVSPVSRHVVQLTHGAIHEKANAVQSAGSDGNLALRLLIGAAGRVGSRINKGENTRQTIGIGT